MNRRHPRPPTSSVFKSGQILTLQAEDDKYPSTNLVELLPLDTTEPTKVISPIHWPERTLTQMEDHVWGEPNFESYVVTNSHRLRNKPLREFTAEDLRFMLGQQISLPLLMPMVLDVLELGNPFVGGESGDSNEGQLLLNALKVDKRFWTENPELRTRMSVVLVSLYAFRDFVETELVPAARAFEAAAPSTLH